VGARDGRTQSARASLFFSFTSNPSPKKLKKLVRKKKNASFLSKLRQRKKKKKKRNYAGEEEKKNALFLSKLRRRKKRKKKNLRRFRHRKLCQNCHVTDGRTRQLIV
jgi:hypothetical protein